MGKRTRTDSDSYECIAKKVKKLNQMLMRARRKNRQSSTSTTSSSSESSSSTSSGSDSPRQRSRARESSAPLEPLCIEDVPTHANETTLPQPTTSATLETQPTASTTFEPPTDVYANPQPSTSSAILSTLQPPAEAGSSANSTELDEDILKILGDDPSQAKSYGKEIQADLAIRLQHMATHGLTKEARKELLDRYLPPSNCTLIDAPTLNPEIKAAISEVVYKRDKGIEQKQKQLSSATSCLAEALTILLAQSGNATLVQLLMDACKLLCDTQHADSMTRRNFVLFNLKKDLKDQLQTTKIDKMLFSEDLPETLKAAKAISKSGAEMKIPVPTKFVKSGPKPAQKNLNWRGPPPSQSRHKGNQRTKEPAHKHRHDNSSKQSSRPVLTRNKR